MWDMSPVLRVLVIAVATSFYAQSSVAGQNKKVYLGTGALFQNMISTTSAADASKSMTGTVYAPHLGLQGDFHGPSGFGLAPTVFYTPLTKTGANGVKKSLLVAALPARWAFGGLAVLRAGPGLMIYSVSGDGGSVDLNNGTGTATFYLPATKSSAKVITVNLGVGIEFGRLARLDVDLIVPGILSSSRAYNLATALNFGVW